MGAHERSLFNKLYWMELNPFPVRVFALPAHTSSDNGLIGMIQVGKVFLGVLAMHFHI
jgi:hypothetical protein